MTALVAFICNAIALMRVLSYDSIFAQFGLPKGADKRTSLENSGNTLKMEVGEKHKN